MYSRVGWWSQCSVLNDDCDGGSLSGSLLLCSYRYMKLRTSGLNTRFLCIHGEFHTNCSLFEECPSRPCRHAQEQKF
jgi:hypothetical protein